MKVVADASPLITLARIGHFDLLPSLYGTIIIPTEVYNEVVLEGAGLPGAKQAAAADWIKVMALRDPALLRAAVEHSVLGAGEISGVLLAKELAADLLLVDESKARSFAMAQGLAVKGCIGILESSQRSGLLSDLREAYLRLLTEKIHIALPILQDSLAKFKLPLL